MVYSGKMTEVPMWCVLSKRMVTGSDGMGRLYSVPSSMALRSSKSPSVTSEYAFINSSWSRLTDSLVLVLVTRMRTTGPSSLLCSVIPPRMSVMEKSRKSRFMRRQMCLRSRVLGMSSAISCPRRCMLGSEDASALEVSASRPLIEDVSAASASTYSDAAASPSIGVSPSGSCPDQRKSTSSPPTAMRSKTLSATVSPLASLRPFTIVCPSPATMESPSSPALVTVQWFFTTEMDCGTKSPPRPKTHESLLITYIYRSERKLSGSRLRKYGSVMDAESVKVVSVTPREAYFAFIAASCSSDVAPPPPSSPPESTRCCISCCFDASCAMS
mmetsp:Transcript_26925/g.88348  ORF Transcript_26925/g.88348 Transcript_26925/m.88348 type:complete len:329 (+) Transcript_26925:543-1529(+)